MCTDGSTIFSHKLSYEFEIVSKDLKRFWKNSYGTLTEILWNIANELLVNFFIIFSLKS